MKQKFLWLVLFALLPFGTLQAQCTLDNAIPFSTNPTSLTVWNGYEYIPFTVKGINLGIAVPGTFPGELRASRAQYGQWFQQIKAIGFNCIRIYTLHYPHFYEVLDSFNLAHPQNPLFIFQGVWLNEEMDGYANDLYTLDTAFSAEIEENIDCVHGNRIIPPRLGKAYGTYTTDISKWNIGYIIGREIHPEEVLETNSQHTTVNAFTGAHFAISSCSASEAWLVSKLDQVVAYEYAGYNTQRPVSASSWPTLDPLLHPAEENRMEDTASVDLSHVVLQNAPAGLFISYHAYPYYPDFISNEPGYQSYSDPYGPNSYKGYLTALKSHYPQYPLIIAEYGVPSSLGVAHYASSGMNHGGQDEFQQGLTDIRMLTTMQEAGCGGGIQFAWIDEWFKRTWITDPIDYLADRRILWHNITAAEQNFGLIAFRKTDTLQPVETFCDTCAIREISASADYDYFNIDLRLHQPLATTDELWIALDTYAPTLGESLLPTADTLPFRAEFALHLTNYAADLYVTQAYDLFGIWHNESLPEQLYHSIPTDGAPWYLVRWKNNAGAADVQYIGSLQVNYGFQPPSSNDAVTLYSDHISLRIPWSLINVVDPSQMRVFNDNRSTPAKEDTISDGFAMAVAYKDTLLYTHSRFQWPFWNTALDAEETIKTSYWVMTDHLMEFNSKVIAFCDSFSFSGGVFPVEVTAQDGVLKNDFDLDGDYMSPLLVDAPLHGHITLNTDGSFTYMPDPGFEGDELFSYCVFDQYSLSSPATVLLHIENNSAFVEYQPLQERVPQINVYPIPSNEVLHIESDQEITFVKLFNTAGTQLFSATVQAGNTTIDMRSYPAGNYYLLTQIEGTALRITKVQKM